jgi:hypothetical protein
MAKQFNNGDPFDLDPCSTSQANNLHEGQLARTIFTLEDDGLGKNWFGSVFVNPPYGLTATGQSSQSIWLEYALNQYAEGNITSCILLLTSSHAYGWFDKVMLLPHAYLIRKLKFWTPQGIESAHQSPQGHILVFIGLRVDNFVDTFASITYSPGLNSWSFVREERDTVIQ